MTDGGAAWDQAVGPAVPEALRESQQDLSAAAAAAAAGKGAHHGGGHQPEPTPGATAAELSAATAGADVLLEVNDLKVHFPIKRGVLIDKTIGYVYAVDGVSLAVRRG